MNYIKVIFTISPYKPEVVEILTAQLGELGYESFIDTDTELEAYIPEDNFNAEELFGIYSPFPDVKTDFIYEVIPDQNWNETWEEKFFSPIIIGNDVMIRGSFHKKDENITHDIVIDPRMAFGTGHHETTSLMINFILEQDLKGKTVLDMGCGTGILGILCSLTGAGHITAIDIEEWAYNNTIENCKKNNISNISVIHGDVKKIGKSTFDIILANINRNILLNDIEHYSKALKPNGLLILSGFYDTDLPLIDKKAFDNDLTFLFLKSDNNWVASSYRKK